MTNTKNNDSLEFAVITGCLRIAKESIFTGTNNFVSDTISDTQLNEYFCSIQREVDCLLADTNLTSYASELRKWYNGYHFGALDFKKSVKAWLIETAAKEDRKILFAALWEGNAKLLTELISDLLFDTISYHDYAESFYHAFLIGLFSNAGYRIESNYENRLGRSDIVIKDRKNRRAVVPEAKRAYYEKQLESECDKALAQIAKSNTQKRWNMMDIRM